MKADTWSVSYSYKRQDRTYPVTGACIVVADGIERAIAVARESIEHDEMTIHGVQRLARGQGELYIAAEVFDER